MTPEQINQAEELILSITQARGYCKAEVWLRSNPISIAGELSRMDENTVIVTNGSQSCLITIEAIDAIKVHG